MSDILIRSMKMPKEGDLIVIRPDEKAYYVSANPQNAYERKAVPVPPHGRLIDADAVYKRLQKQAMSVWGDGNPRYQIILDVMDAIRFAPTIIPAEEDE